MKKRFKYLSFVLHAAVLAGLIVAGTKYVNGGAMTAALQRFDGHYAAPILALSLGYVLVKGWRFTTMLRHLSNVRKSVILRAYVAGQACTLLPGGMAARAGILEQVGVPAAETAAPIAVSSLSDQAFLIATSLVVALWFDAVRRPVGILLGALALVSVVLGMEASRTWLIGLIERLMGRFKLLDHWRTFTASLKAIATPTILLGGLVNTAVAFGLLFVALALALRGVGAPSVPLATLVLAFCLPTLLGRLSALPGGVGVTETGMISVLSHAPGVSVDQAAVAVAVFRVGTVLFAAVVGGLVYLLGWRHTAGKKVSAS